ncbi:MAG TPA: hypothetical protein VN520_22845 [Streptomyces sp.]|nr:hypothetical protein [Streptomyces sp.]HWU09184.1 hypothetical protein [Streptomyces sp.]
MEHRFRQTSIRPGRGGLHDGFAQQVSGRAGRRLVVPILFLTAPYT